MHMSRQQQRTGEKGKKGEDQKQGAQPSGFPMGREHRVTANPRVREIREVTLSRHYLNDLYERSSI
jgi:hypothetical protein